MSSSRTQNDRQLGFPSFEKASDSFSASRRSQSPVAYGAEAAGTMNDAVMVREVIREAMRNCKKSRVEIADQMSHLTGTKVTERMLNGYAADCREDVRFPAELDRAFCAATGDVRLLTCRAEAAGLFVIDSAGMELLEIGRQYLIRKRSEAELADLERRLEGKAL